MALRAEDVESGLIEAVCERVRERLPADQAEACVAFIRQYYRWVPPEDLSDRSPLDLYGAAVAHWNLAQRRERGQAKVRVYNPEFDEDGWQSPHTVIEVVSDDMQSRAKALVEEFTEHPPPVDGEEVTEVREFLEWLIENNFTFLGYREYDIARRETETYLEPVEDSGLGILRGNAGNPRAPLGPKAVALARAP